MHLVYRCHRPDSQYRLSQSSSHLKGFRGHRTTYKGIDTLLRRARHRRIRTVAESTGTEDSNNLFIFGFGYLGLGLATQLAKKGWSVKGTCRSADKQRDLKELGYEAFLFDTDHLTLGLGTQGVAALREATHVLVTVSPLPPSETCPIRWLVGQNFKAVSKQIRWVGYLSSTSVYGDYDGDWVTEESELRAEAGNGFARQAIEGAWLTFGAATGLPVHSFRLAGIYGPDRNALTISSRGGKRSGKLYTSRCHAYDICQVLMASMALPQPGEVYNVADDDPTNRETVLDYVRSHFQLAQATETAEARVLQPSREEKRVCNKKIKEQLGIKLAFPSYKEGLEAIHQGDRTPFP